VISNATYQSYIIRFWRDNPQGIWRASLHSTADNEKFVFAAGDDLFKFLATRLTADEELTSLSSQYANGEDEPV